MPALAWLGIGDLQGRFWSEPRSLTVCATTCRLTLPRRLLPPSPNATLSGRPLLLVGLNAIGCGDASCLIWLGRDFLRSRSGRGFLLHLVLCAMLSAGVGFGFYFFSLNWFKAHKAEEKAVALRLVDAFVTNYSALRSEFGAERCPCRRHFRAHSIEAFNKGMSGGGELSACAGSAGPARKSPPGPRTTKMAKTIDPTPDKIDPKPQSSIVSVDGQLKFRTIYPSLRARTKLRRLSQQAAAQPELETERSDGRVCDRRSDWTVHDDPA